MAPPLLPLAVLALASGAGAGPPSPPPPPPPVAGVYTGRTEQGRAITIRVRPKGRRASWRIRYRGRCDDGSRIRGGYRSGGGTPLLSFDRQGDFAVSGKEPAPFSRGGTGTARFRFSGRLGREGGSGTWRVTVNPPRPGGRSVSCTSGAVRWGAAPG